MKGHRRVSVWLPDNVAASVDRMSATGLYGLTCAATSTQLLLRAIREEVTRNPRLFVKARSRQPATAETSDGRRTRQYNEQYQERLAAVRNDAQPVTGKPRVSDTPCTECGNFSVVGDHCFVCEAKGAAP